MGRENKDEDGAWRRYEIPILGIAKRESSSCRLTRFLNVLGTCTRQETANGKELPVHVLNTNSSQSSRSNLRNMYFEKFIDIIECLNSKVRQT